MKFFTMFQFMYLIYLLYSFIMITANPIPLPEFIPTTTITTTIKSTPTTSSTPLNLPTAAEAVFTNPSNLSTAITGQITFIKTPQNKTNVSGKLNSGIFDTVVANYKFKVVDRSKTLLYDLTSDGLNEWSVKVPGTTPFQHNFDKLSISKIVNQFFEISHHKKGIVGMTIIKAISGK